MAEYHVGCGFFGIYAGILKPNKPTEWKGKTECTDEAIEAVRDYMIDHCLGGFECRKDKSGGWEWKLKDGRTVQLIIEIKGGEEDGQTEIVQQLRKELENVKAERDSLLKEFAGECGLCANYEKCKKYPCYCIDGNMWEYRGSKESESVSEESNSGYRNWIMGRFERGE